MTAKLICLLQQQLLLLLLLQNPTWRLTMQLYGGLPYMAKSSFQLMEWEMILLGRLATLTVLPSPRTSTAKQIAAVRPLPGVHSLRSSLLEVEHTFDEAFDEALVPYYLLFVCPARCFSHVQD